MLGVGRETISKGLSKLSQKGVIEVDGKNIKIIQMEELNKIAGLD
jgi:DNA-binding transcriptional regulator YhcF (GntR family)